MINTSSHTLILIKRITLAKIKEMKIIEKESYGDVIERLINSYDNKYSVDKE